MQTSRIGLLVPSSNTTVETEFRRVLPDHVTLHCARLFIDHVNLETIGQMTSTMEYEAKLLASADIDLIMLGATAPSFLLGQGHDKAVCKQLEAVTGKPATTTSTALLEALRQLGVKKIAVGSVFNPTVNGVCVNFLESNGFDVVASHSLNVTDNLKIGRLASQTSYEVALEVDRDDAEAIVLACTNWQSLDVIEKIEQKLGKPVIATGQASVWHALRLLGHAEPIEGFGALLSKH